MLIATKAGSVFPNDNLCSGELLYYQSVGGNGAHLIFDIPGEVGAKSCTTTTWADGSVLYVVFTVDNVFAATRCSFLGTSLNWDGNDPWNQNSRDWVSCHCPWGKPNWHVECKNGAYGEKPGMVLKGLNKNDYGIYTVDGGHYCHVAPGTAVSKGCSWLFDKQQTAYEIKTSYEMIGRPLYVCNKETEILLFGNVAMYFQNGTLFYQSGSQQIMGGGSNTNFGNGYVTQIEDIRNEVGFRFKDDYITYDTKGNLYRMPKELVDIAGDPFKLYNAIVTPGGKLQMNEPMHEVNCQKSNVLNYCDNTQGSHWTQMASQMPLEGRADLILTNQMEVLSVITDNVTNDQIILFTVSPIFQLDLQAVYLGISPTGASSYTASIGCNNLPFIQNIDCPPYNQYTDTIECIMTYIISVPLIESLTVNGEFDAFYLFSSPGGKINISVPSENVLAGVLPVCFTRTLGCESPVCNNVKMNYVYLEPEMDLPDEPDGVEPTDPDDPNGGTDPGAAFGWYWILLIVGVSTLIIGISIWLIWKFYGKMIIERMGMQKTMRAMRKKKAERDRKIAMMKFNKEMEEMGEDLDTNEEMSMMEGMEKMPITNKIRTLVI